MINLESQGTAQIQVPPGMLWIPGGTFRMGSDDFYPEEAPVHEVNVDGLWMDPYTITNELFSRFVEATGYITLAERALNPADYPGAPPENLVPGALVFKKTRGPVDLKNYVNWWTWTPGTNWKTSVRPTQFDQRGSSSIRWFTSPTRTPKLTRAGQAKNCRLKPSGSELRVAV